MKTTLIKLLTIGATASLGLFAQSASAQGKAEVAKEALDAAIELGPKLHKLISDVPRSCKIVIRNHSKYALTDIRTYSDSGKVVGLDLGRRVPAKGAGGVLGKKSDGGVGTGAVGVVSYRIEGTDERLFLMYSVPGDFNLYDAWFDVQVGGSGWATNEDQFDSMYDGDPIKAGNEHTFTGFAIKDTAAVIAGLNPPAKYKVVAVMEDQGNTELIIDFYNLD